MSGQSEIVEAIKNIILENDEVIVRREVRGLFCTVSSFEEVEEAYVRYISEDGLNPFSYAQGEICKLMVSVGAGAVEQVGKAIEEIGSNEIDSN